METQKSSELRVRLRRLKSGTEKLRTGMSSTSTSNVPSTSATSSATTTMASNLVPQPQSSDSEDDDFATVHFKLAAALEAAAAHASGLSFDWCKSSNSDVIEDRGLEAPQPNQPNMPDETNPAEGNQISTCTGSQQDNVADVAEELVQFFLSTPHHSSSSSSVSDEATEDLVNIMIASPASSACSSDDEAAASIAAPSKQPYIIDNILTTVEPPSNVSNDKHSFQSPLAPSKENPSDVLPQDTSDAADGGATANPTNTDMDEDDDLISPTTVVTNILALPPFDPYAPQSKVQLIIKQIVSLAQLKQRIVDSSKGAISKNGPLSECERLAEMVR